MKHRWKTKTKITGGAVDFTTIVATGVRERSGARMCALVLKTAWSPSRRSLEKEIMKAPKMD